MDKRSSEIRRILLGKYQRTAEGSLAAITPDERRRILPGMQGHSTGRFAMRILGIAHRSQRCSLQSELSKEQLDRKMKTLGQLAVLESAPAAAGCLCKHWMTAPVFLLADRDGDCIEMTAYTARGIFAPVVCRRALRRLRNALSETTEKRKEQGAKRKRR